MDQHRQPPRPDPALLDTALPPGEVLAQLPPAVRDLVLANHTLYQGRWDDLAEDVRRRQAGRPYLFKLDPRLEDPLGWIASLKNYEHASGHQLCASPAS